MLFAHDRELSSVSMNARSLHLSCPVRPVELYAQRERCTNSAAKPTLSVIVITISWVGESDLNDNPFSLETCFPVKQHVFHID